MKLNNKGFAVTAVLYGLLILFVILVGSYLTVLNTRKNRLDNLIKEMEDEYNGVISVPNSESNSEPESGSNDINYEVNITLIAKDDDKIETLDTYTSTVSYGGSFSHTFTIDNKMYVNKNVYPISSLKCNDKNYRGFREVTGGLNRNINIEIDNVVDNLNCELIIMHAKEGTM